MTRDEAVKLVMSSSFTQEEKAMWVERLALEGLTPDVLQDLYMATVDALQGLYKKAGIEIDETDPKFEADHAEMMEEMTRVEAEFKKESEKIDKELKSLSEEIDADGDVLNVAVAKAQLAAS